MYELRLFNYAVNTVVSGLKCNKMSLNSFDFGDYVCMLYNDYIII